MDEQLTMTKRDFIAYLQDTLIPDLRDSGSDATADDFETAILFLQGAEAVVIGNGVRAA